MPTASPPTRARNVLGVLSLTSLATPIRSTARSERRWLVVLGLFGASLLYGDRIFTPAILVRSAVEGAGDGA